MRRILVIFFIFFTFLSLEGLTAAVEVAPRITDREIVESLTDIKATQKAIIRQYEELSKYMDKRFEQVDKRFEQVDKRFEQVDKRFEQVDKRFEQVDKRFEELQTNIRFLFGIVITMIIALFGYMIWDRRTMMKPLETKVIDIEMELGIGSKEGTKLIRLMNAMRELSKEDPKVERILREYHLL